MSSPELTIRLQGLRGIIARRMMQSAASTARVTLHADLDASALVGARTALKERIPSLSFEDLLLHVLARALPAHALLNGTTSEREIHLSAAVSIGIAVALEGGLVVPTLADVPGMSLAEIAARRADLLERAQAGRLAPGEMRGATFTVSNIGFHRVRYFTPLINVPQIAILGVGCIALQPWVGAGGALCARPVLGLSLSFDHRAVDGEPAAAFLSDLAARLERLEIPELPSGGA